MALIRARIARGLTQRELAERVGLAEQAIQRYEAGDYAGVSFARVVEIADALDVTVQLRRTPHRCEPSRHDPTTPEPTARLARAVGATLSVCE